GGVCRQVRQQRMEPLWSPVVATGGKPLANRPAANRARSSKTVAVGCDRLPQRAHGKGHVDSTSLLLRRGSPSWLRKEKRVRERYGSDSSGKTIHTRARRLVRTPRAA